MSVTLSQILFSVGGSLVSGLPEEHEHVRALQQGLDQGEDLHLAQATGRAINPESTSSKKIRKLSIFFSPLKCLFSVSRTTCNVFFE
jgi:hypothetical protein